MLNYQGCDLVYKDLGMTKRCNVAHLANKYNQSQNSRNCIIHHPLCPLYQEAWSKKFINLLTFILRFASTTSITLGLHSATSLMVLFGTV